MQAAKKYYEHQINYFKNKDNIHKIMLLVRVLNNFIRHDILNHIYINKEIIVTDIYTKLRLEQSVVSQHLAALKSVYIIKCRRSGKNIYYSVDREIVMDYIKLINNISTSDNAFMSDTKIDFGNITYAFEFLRVVSHDLRQNIISFILNNNNFVNVNVIYNNLNLQQSVTSQHLRLLREIGVCKTKKDGKKIFYMVNDVQLSNHINLFDEFIKTHDKSNIFFIDK
jgi:DNA-binding transcriptional ArsR family regulator